MIAQLKIDNNIIATLEDDLQWNCGDSDISAIWNEQFPIGHGALPLDAHIQSVLRQITDESGAEIVWFGVPDELLEDDPDSESSEYILY